ncbi:MAG: UDP-2,4-diacetamido-2,4,6-trideoxy-beta-L-altropyranose hydrolase [Clostridia bacterium]|nr:UDP-2,4-diacetamido-2,4,6-trideoxy-beta-L-altropyranose hydrolase [Clostridia bacterium]
MIKVAFRADGGPQMGMGHIIRCLSLASEFRKQGFDVIFLSKYQEGIDRIINEKFEIFRLESTFSAVEHEQGFHYGDMLSLEKEAGEIIKCINENCIDILVVDSYNVTHEYLLLIKKFVKILSYIDDINKFTYPVNILINGNITGEYMNYTKYYNDEIMLLGPKYNLIRNEFKNIPLRSINRKINKIMITTGGADPYNLTCKIVEDLMEDSYFNNITFNIIVGNAFTNKEEIIKMVGRYSNLILHENVKSMAKIMLDSDIAISSGGSTLYELCACGTPTTAIILANNQEFIVKKMDEAGYVIDLGWYNEMKKDIITKKIKQLSENYSHRLELCKRAIGLIDGYGTERIVEVFRKYINVLL